MIALVDGDDVFGIFAANGLTKLIWGIAAAVLLVLALLPRVGGDKRREHTQQRDDARRFERESPTTEREPAGARSSRLDDQSTPESRQLNR